MQAPTAPVAQGETVSQSEIENLLAQIGSGDALPVEADANRPKTAAGDFQQRHDFPPLSLFSIAELRKLRMRHEEFITALSARLSIRLGMEVNMQMSKLETATLEKFVDGLANPTHVTVLKMEPLLGNCLLDIPLRLGLSLVDRELGGPGVWQDEPRELTKMEVGLISHVVETILSEWCAIWSDLLDLRPVLISSENNGRFIQNIEPKTNLLVLGMELQLGATPGEMQLGIPCSMLEPLLFKLSSLKEKGQKPAIARATAPVNWNPVLDDMEMQLTAELPELKLTAGQLAELKAGDIIPLPPEMVNRLRICLEGTPKFMAVLGKDNEQWAVKIVEAIKP